MAERTHFPCCVVAMATPNPAPIRLCDLIVSESQTRISSIIDTQNDFCHTLCREK